VIDCYLLDSDYQFKLQVFKYIENEIHQVIRLNNRLKEEMNQNHEYHNDYLRNSQSSSQHHYPHEQDEDQQILQNNYDIALQAMKTAIIIQLAVLIELDRTCAVKLVMQLFSNEHKRVLKALADTPKQLYSLFCAIDQRNQQENDNGIGSSNSDANNGGGTGGNNNNDGDMNNGIDDISQNDDDGGMIILDESDIILYIQLMAKFESNKVYHYLYSHGNDYPLGDCVKICRDHKITDAEAFLLERTGDISGALELTLQSIQNCLETLKMSLRRVGKEGLVSMGILPRGISTDSHSNNANGQAVLKKLKDGQAIQRNLGVAIEICERSTTEGGGEQEQALWNYLLDRLLAIKTMLKLNGELSYHRLTMEAVLTEVMHCAWNKMSVYVPLAQIVRKITDDHSSTHLGELRDIIVSVLEASASENTIYATSVSLVANDVYALVDKRKKISGAGKSNWQLQDDEEDENKQEDISEREVLFSQNDSEHEALMTKARLDRLARRTRPHISLQDQLVRAGQPSLLAIIPNGIPHPEVPPEGRVPGSLPLEARFNSEF